ncbi:hypothetical protein PoB_001790400 [Plakobranchus ocellatus]|uniref:Protein tweety homolog n=1 Tax=Plakobranchus ocellatus TaxID=259542 RepID=A0AAV3ZAI7_9GAST|nr:hypothetical protein PoB_001790400 [Plakobranchus ocellatus]
MADYDNYNNLYQFITTTSTTTPRPWDRGHHDDVELDDTAPLPLLIGIGLALFIGFVILVLICCCCRRPRSPPSSGTLPPVSQAVYQRAPFSDGIGGGVSYPMTALPPEPGYPNTVLGCPPPNSMVPVVKRDYGMIGSGPGLAPMTETMHQVPQHLQSHPHFGGVPTFPQNQYLTSHAQSPIPGHPTQTSIAHQGPFSPSSHASSSSASGPSGDPHVPTMATVPTSTQKFSYQQQKSFPGQNYQYQVLPQQYFHPMMPPPHLSQQPQLYMSGQNSQAMIHSDSFGNNIGHNNANMNSNQPFPIQNFPTTSQPQSLPPSLITSHNQRSPASLDDHEDASTDAATGAATDSAISTQSASENPLVSDKLLPPDENARPLSLNSSIESEEDSGGEER